MLSGCGQFQSVKREYVGYYQVNWTADGDLIASKRQSRIDYGSSISFDGESRKETHQIVKINPESLIETVILDVPWYDEISSFSGFGVSTLFGYLIDNGYQEAYLKIVKNGEFSYPRRISLSFLFPRIVWSPDRQHFGISINDEKFFIYDLNGALIKERNDGGHIVWKNNQELFFYSHGSQKAALYSLNSDTVTVLNHNIRPGFYDAAQNRLLSVKDGVMFTYNLDLDSVTTKTLSYDFLTLDSYSFSPNGQKLALSKKKVYQASGYTLSQADQPSFGIHLYDLDRDELTKVRD